MYNTSAHAFTVVAITCREKYDPLKSKSCKLAVDGERTLFRPWWSHIVNLKTIFKNCRKRAGCLLAVSS